MRYRPFIVLLIIAMLLCCFQIARADDDSEIVGEWYLSDMIYEGLSVDPTSAGASMKISFEKDGSCEFWLKGNGQEDSFSGIWSIENNQYEVALGGDFLYFVLTGDKISTNINGIDMILTRDGTETIEEVAIVEAENKGIFDGFWEMTYADDDGVRLSIKDPTVSNLNADVLLRISTGKVESHYFSLGEETSETLDSFFMNGKLFLSFEGDQVSTIQLLENGQIRYEVPHDTSVIYLSRIDENRWISVFGKYEKADESPKTIVLNSESSVEATPEIVLKVTPEPIPEIAIEPEPTSVPYVLPKDANRSITINNDSLSVSTGNQLKLKTEIKRLTEDAPYKSVLEWSSSDDSIATVNAQGIVTGKAPGYVIISGNIKDNPEIKVYATVKVVQPVKTVKVEEQNITLVVGNTEESSRGKIMVQILPENATVQKCSFKSGDESIVTVDAEGNLQALSIGKTRIIISPLEEGTRVTAVCNVTVAQAVESVTIPDAITIYKKKSYTLKPEIEPKNASNKKVEYTSSDETVAKVRQDGVVSGIGCGNAIITCSAIDGSGVATQCKVTVIQAVSGIKLSEKSLKLSVGASRTITATILPDDATNKKVVWKSSDDKVASVSVLGTVIGRGRGECTITCTTDDGSFSASIKAYVASFSFRKTEYTVTSKNGLTIPIERSGTDRLTLTDNGGSVFDAEWKDHQVFIIPLSAGKSTFIVYNPNIPQDKVTITVTVDRSAVYDSTAYPKISYSNAARYPDRYRGDKCSFSGKVLQVISESTTTSYRISSRT